MGASDRVIKQVASVKGREEDVTSRLANELTGHLLDAIKSKLGSEPKRLKGVSLQAYVTKKTSEEPGLGADLLVALVVHDSKGQVRLAKAFLAQAKVGIVKQNKKKVQKTPIQIVARERRILGQAKTMLDVSPDSFFFLYSDAEIRVTSAFEVVLYHKSVVDTERMGSKKLGVFFRDYFRCFIGDHRIGMLCATPQDFEAFAKTHQVSRGVLFTLTADDSLDADGRP